jgi:hypothetical protein
VTVVQLSVQRGNVLHTAAWVWVDETGAWHRVALSAHDTWRYICSD